MKIISWIMLVVAMSSQAVAGGRGRFVSPVRVNNFRCDVPVSSIRLGKLQPSVTASFIHNGQVAALVSPVLYSVNPYGQQYQQQQSMHSLSELVQRAVAAELQRLGVTGTMGLSQSLVTQNCSECHGENNPKAGFSVFGDMTAEEKLKAISRILHSDPEKRMPKGKPIDDDIRGRLIDELAKTRPTK